MGDDTNPKDRLGALKPDLSLVPPAATVYAAIALKEGADKYGAYNWRDKKVRATVYHAALHRHMGQWLDGEDVDPTSGTRHLSNAIACLCILIDAEVTGNLIDDRPTKGGVANLIRSLTVTPKKEVAELSSNVVTSKNLLQPDQWVELTDKQN